MKQDLVTLQVRLWTSDHLDLKKLAFLTDKPMSEIIRDLVTDYLKDKKKMLTRSDVVVS